jgi:dihydrolipoamide dehydrogenase
MRPDETRNVNVPETTMADQFDVIVIGAGPGGYVAAIRAAQLGMSVAIIDKRNALGGTCLNVGCIPSKAMLDSSELFVNTRSHLSQHGIKVADLQLDLAAMLARKDGVVKTLTKGIAGLMRKHRIKVVTGTARLTGKRESEGHEVAIKSDGTETTLLGRNIILATGSEPMQIPSMPFDGVRIVTSTEALAFDAVPKHLIVVGAGYIGLELGSVWNRLGAKVSVVEALPRIVPFADVEMGTLLRKSLEKQGLSIQLDTRVAEAKVKGDMVAVRASQNGNETTIEGDRVLVAVGRRPYTSGLGLKEAGVALDEKSSRVKVSDGWATNVPGIHAIGDLIEGPMLAHKAEDEGIAVAERLVGQKTTVRHDTIPSVIYTWPELASVGQTEEQLREKGIEYKVGKFPFQANGRARCMDETEGLVKVLADTNTDRVLGVHLFGPRVSELVAECVAVMEFSGSAEDIARITHAHPTLTEAVREAALAVAGRAIHI